MIGWGGIGVLEQQIGFQNAVFLPSGASFYMSLFKNCGIG